MHSICSAVGTFTTRESLCFVFMLFKASLHSLSQLSIQVLEGICSQKQRHSLSPAASPLKSSIFSGPKSLCCTQLMNRALCPKEPCNFKRKSLVSHVPVWVHHKYKEQLITWQLSQSSQGQPVYRLFTSWRSTPKSAFQSCQRLRVNHPGHSPSPQLLSQTHHLRAQPRGEVGHSNGAVWSALEEPHKNILPL